jgi:hypothetical protein
MRENHRPPIWLTQSWQGQTQEAPKDPGSEGEESETGITKKTKWLQREECTCLEKEAAMANEGAIGSREGVPSEE